MKIIANKNNLYNSTHFLNRLHSEDYINGAVFNVFMIKDGTIIIFNEVSSNNSNLTNLQAKTYAQIQAEDIMTLDDALFYINGIQKKVILNLIPVVQSLPIHQAMEEYQRKNEIYIKSVNDIIQKYPSLDIYVASISNKLIYHMKNHMKDRKLGLVVSPENMGYEDLDFYIFTSILYDIKVCLEQSERKKEIMIYVSSSNDLNTIYQSLQNNPLNSTQTEILDEMYFITYYPELLFKLFK